LKDEVGSFGHCMIRKLVIYPGCLLLFGVVESRKYDVLGMSTDKESMQNFHNETSWKNILARVRR
jgi:hypothetical protein